MKYPITKSLTTGCLPEWSRHYVDKRLEFLPNEQERNSLIAETKVLLREQPSRFEAPVLRDRSSYMGVGQRYGELYAEMAGLLSNVSVRRIPYRTRYRMLKDPDVNFGIGIWGGFLKGLDWTIKCDDPGQRKFLTQAMKRIYPKAIGPIVDGNLIDGFSSARLVWDVDDFLVTERSESGRPKQLLKRPAFYIKKIRDMHPDSIRVRVTKQGDLVGVLQRQVTGEDVPIRNGYGLSHTALRQRHGDPFGESWLIPPQMPYYWKLIAQFIGMKYCERQGTPHLKGRGPRSEYQRVDGTTASGLRLVLEQAASMIETGIAIMPSDRQSDGSGYLFDIDYMSGERRGDMLLDFVRFWSHQIQRSFLFPDKAVSDQSSGGTSAAAESGRDLWIVTLSPTIMVLQLAMNEDFVWPLQRANFSRDRIAYAELVYRRPDFDRMPIVKEGMRAWMQTWPGLMAVGKFPKFTPDMEMMSEVTGVAVGDIRDQVIDIGREMADEKRARRKQREEIAGRLAAGKPVHVEGEEDISDEEREQQKLEGEDDDQDLEEDE
jgi:hypothetical protein